MNDAQRRLLTYLLVQHGQEEFTFYDLASALKAVFPENMVGKGYKISIREFMKNKWFFVVGPHSTGLLGHVITNKALKEMQE